jgi:hypothetical protein
MLTLGHARARNSQNIGTFCGAKDYVQMDRRGAHYRRYAKECLALAEEARDPSMRHLLRGMAFGWHELAVMSRWSPPGPRHGRAGPGDLPERG